MTGQLLEKDSELWEAFKLGDASAYECMFKDNYALLLNYGLKFNRNVVEVEDCVQQLFARLWESRSRLGQNNSIRGYLLASLRRMILRETKRKPMLVDLEVLDFKFMLNHFDENKTLKKINDEETASLVNSLLGKLPGRQKEALYLRYYGDQEFDAIAEVMGITTRAVYKLIYKAMAKLSAILEDQKQQPQNETSLAAS